MMSLPRACSDPRTWPAWIAASECLLHCGAKNAPEPGSTLHNAKHPTKKCRHLGIQLNRNIYMSSKESPYMSILCLSLSGVSLNLFISFEPRKNICGGIPGHTWSPKQTRSTQSIQTSKLWMLPDSSTCQVKLIIPHIPCLQL